MGKKYKDKIEFKGFFAVGLFEDAKGRTKEEKLSPPFTSRDAAETTRDLLKADPEVLRKYKDIVVVEK